MHMHICICTCTHACICMRRLMHAWRVHAEEGGGVAARRCGLRQTQAAGMQQLLAAARVRLVYRNACPSIRFRLRSSSRLGSLRSRLAAAMWARCKASTTLVGGSSGRVDDNLLGEERRSVDSRSSQHRSQMPETPTPTRWARESGDVRRQPASLTLASFFEPWENRWLGRHVGRDRPPTQHTDSSIPTLSNPRAGVERA